jgi:hypothetical protein
MTGLGNHVQGMTASPTSYLWGFWAVQHICKWRGQCLFLLHTETRPWVHWLAFHRPPALTLNCQLPLASHQPPVLASVPPTLLRVAATSP